MSGWIQIRRFTIRHSCRRSPVSEAARAGDGWRDWQKTIAAMNVPVAARIDQIRVNMERSRWIFRDLPNEFVMIDIAGFQATLVKNMKPVWEAAVQVGTPYRQTPIFQDVLEYLVFNPTWTVPPTIFENDLLPALKSDPNTFRRRA